MSTAPHTVLRPTVLHVMFCFAHQIEPLPVLVESKDKKRYGRLSINDYLRLVARGEL